MTPRAYAHECGPSTVAVLTGSSPAEAARLLWGARQMWWDRRRAHPQGCATYGTSEEAIADVLVRSGYGVERWGAGGELIADADVYREWLAREAERRVRRGIVHHTARGAPSPPAPSSQPTLRPLAEWLERHPGGGWWFYTVADGSQGHVVSAYGSRLLLASDERCTTWPVYGAHRVFKPRRN